MYSNEKLPALIDTAEQNQTELSKERISVNLNPELMQDSLIVENQFCSQSGRDLDLPELITSPIYTSASGPAHSKVTTGAARIKTADFGGDEDIEGS